MLRKKLITLVAAAVIGVAFIAVPGLAAARGGGGGSHGGGGGHGGGGHGGGGGFHGGGSFHGGGGFSGTFGGRVGGGSIGVARLGGLRMGGVRVARAPFMVHRAFFPRHRVFARRFVRPFFGYGLYADYSCWRWVPTPLGLERVWACSYPY